MNKLIKTMLFSLIVLLPLGAKAEICNEQSKWWPVCKDTANGPDIGTPEWISCQARGGCN